MIAQPQPLVAILNSMDDIIDTLSLAFEQAGFRTVGAKLSEIQSGVLDLVAFVQEHEPDAIVYDIPRPYEANWNFLRLMRDTSSLGDLGWVVTTTNRTALVAALGPVNVIEIVLGKPYTVDEVVAAVRLSLSVDGCGQTKG
jgi:CheY-like chemotaxis protein